jgi:hypothetical protein
MFLRRADSHMFGGQLDNVCFVGLTYVQAATSSPYKNYSLSQQVKSFQQPPRSPVLGGFVGKQSRPLAKKVANG